MRKGLYILLITALLLVATAGIASAITDGELDGEGHPHVVLLLMDVGGEPKYRCSATMLSPTVVLTAGHCTSNYPGDVYTGMRIYTESDVDGGDGITNDYTNGTCDLGNCIEAASWAAHPDYEDYPWYTNDVGVVILEEPFYLDEYGVLPPYDGYIEGLILQRKQDVTFTSVGYGLQISFPTAAAWKEQADRVRMVTNPFLIQLNAPGMTGDYSLLLSNNPNTGGTCYGDSGGPNFIGSGDAETNIVAGVTSFGMNPRCKGIGGVFRMDRQNVLDFVSSFLGE